MPEGVAEGERRISTVGCSKKVPVASALSPPLPTGTSAVRPALPLPTGKSAVRPTLPTGKLAVCPALPLPTGKLAVRPTLPTGKLAVRPARPCRLESWRYALPAPADIRVLLDILGGFAVAAILLERVERGTEYLAGGFFQHLFDGVQESFLSMRMPPFYQVNASRGYFSMCRGGLAAEGRAYSGGRLRAPGGCAATPACAGSPPPPPPLAGEGRAWAGFYTALPVLSIYGAIQAFQGKDFSDPLLGWL